MPAVVNDRKCEACGNRVPPGTPRRRDGRGRMVCGQCFQTQAARRLYEGDEPVEKIAAAFDAGEKHLTERPSPRRDAMRARTAATIKEAHDSGDQVNIYHCPFCGSGQVIGRSDRTVECTFCQAVFTVQVQPMYSAFPQTIDGQPVQEPGMPGMDGQPEVSDDEQLPVDGQDPDALPPGDDEGTGDEADEDDQDDDQPPFLKGSMLRTSNGTPVPMDELLNHLALLQAAPEERPAVLAMIREGRRR